MLRKSWWLDVRGMGPRGAALGLGRDPGPLGPPSGGQGWGRPVRPQKPEAEGGLAAGAGAALSPGMAPHSPSFCTRASASHSPAEGAACVRLTSALWRARRSRAHASPIVDQLWTAAAPRGGREKDAFRSEGTWKRHTQSYFLGLGARWGVRWLDWSLQHSPRPWGAAVGCPAPARALRRMRRDPCRHSSQPGSVCVQSAAGGGSVPRIAQCGRQKLTAPGPPSGRRRQTTPHSAGLGIRSPAGAPELRAPACLPTPRTPPCPSATGASLGGAETLLPQDARPCRPARWQHSP